jgi:hypothetical protein
METLNIKQLTENEKERYEILSHSPNDRKTDKEFKEWKLLCAKVGATEPTRMYSRRALHEIQVK